MNLIFTVSKKWQNHCKKMEQLDYMGEIPS